MLPDGLEERFRELRRRPTARKALKVACAVAKERTAYATDVRLWLPEEPLLPPRNEPPPEPLAAAEGSAARAYLDAHDRPVRVRWNHGLGSSFLTWDESQVEVVFLYDQDDGVAHVTWVDIDGEGRVAGLARRGVPHNSLGKGACVAWCDWQGEVCTRVRAVEQPDESPTRWLPRVRVGEYDGEGLARVLAGTGPAASDADDALVALGAVALDSVAWNRDIDGYESDPMPGHEALDAWADALLAAARDVAQRERGPFYTVRLHAPFTEPGPFLELRTVAVRDAARRRARDPIDVLGAESRDVALLPTLPPGALRALRSLRQLYRASSIHDDLPWPSRPVAERLLLGLDELAWDRGEPFLPMLGWEMLPYTETRGTDPYLAFPRAVFGNERVEEFRASLERPAGVAGPPPVKRPPRSRDEIAAHLRARELDPGHADEAAWGIALLPGGKGRSRVGGAPLLPEGMEWPTNEGLGLTHLASIDLAELPDVEGRHVLPPDGLLVLLADLTEEASLWEPARIGDDTRIVLLHVSAETPTHEPKVPRATREPDETPVKMRLRRVRFEPVLTLRQHYAPGYDDLYEDLAAVTPGLGDPGHLMLGHPAVVQDDPREPGEVNVLHIGWDEALGFEFLDAGDLTLHGDAADVHAGRWDLLTLSPNSC